MKYIAELRNANLPKNLKVIRLWALTQLYYRQQEGEEALSYLHELITPEGTNALMFISGFLTGKVPTEEQLLKLVPGLSE